MARTILFQCFPYSGTVIRMLLKNYTPKLSFVYILILFLWGIISASSCPMEMSDIICVSEESYVNHSSAIIPLDRTFPSQKYLSVRNFNAQETVSAPRGRQIRPLPRTVRNIIAALFYGCLLSGIFFFSGFPKEHEIPSHRFCAIIIINYIHHQDGQKNLISFYSTT